MDYLVNLSLLGPNPEVQQRMEGANVTIRRALAPETNHVTAWVAERFGDGWASETAVAMTRLPPTCYIATQNETLIGFACHESIARGYFGPTGVAEERRGLGVGHALLLACLLDLKTIGYGYAIIGDVGPAAFYEKTVNAMPIPNSAPGVWAGMLKI